MRVFASQILRPNEPRLDESHDEGAGPRERVDDVDALVSDLPRPKCFLNSASTLRMMKSPTSIGVYTIPRDFAVFENANWKNFSYNSLMTRCLPAALSIPSQRRRTDS